MESNPQRITTTTFDFMILIKCWKVGHKVSVFTVPKLWKLKTVVFIFRWVNFDKI